MGHGEEALAMQRGQAQASRVLGSWLQEAGSAMGPWG